MDKHLSFLGLEIQALFGNPGDVLLGSTFLIPAALLFLFGMGPNVAYYGHIILWILIFFSQYLTLDSFFAKDYREGALETISQSSLSLGSYSFLKILAYWSVATIPNLVGVFLLAYGFQVPPKNSLLLLVVILIGSPAITLVCALGGALSLGAKRASTTLMMIPLFPLFIPPLMFGLMVFESGLVSLRNPGIQLFLGYLAILGPLGMIAVPWALRESIRDL